MKVRTRKKVAIFAVLVVFLAALIAGCIVVFRERQLNRWQENAIGELDANIGRYDESKIVLNNTSHSAAKGLAEKLDAELRITKDGTFAALTLREGTTIRDVYEDRDNRQYLPQMSADYVVETSDVSDTVSGERIPSAPNYSVSDTYYQYQSYLDYLNIGDAWNSYRGNGITVAVIDTGIDYDHPEFAGRISEYSYNATEDKVVKDYDNDWSLIDDEQGHGTAVAGTIGAAMDGEGTIGVAPEVTLLVIKAKCSPNGVFYRTSDLVFGMYYAIERDVDIINMSFGGYGGNAYAAPAKLAVESDIICVAAAGNDSTSALMYPAADENVIGVGALAADSFELAWYSNYGENSDIVAPGTVYTTQAGGSYGTINGTSFASPIVAGALALLKNQTNYMEMADVVELLYAASADLGGVGEDWFFGYGALDVNALVCEERGKVTFDMLTDEVEDIEQVFIRNHTLQNLPEPERNYAVFDGWYYDIHGTEELNWYTDVFTSDITLYAGWVNEDDGVPYTYVILDDGTVEIRSYTGHRRYITIPERIEGRVVSSIGDFAFEGQSRLRQINLPDGLTNIGLAAFSGCTELTGIEIPDGVKSIGSQAFYNNARLSEVVWSEDIALTTIGDMAFANCGSLTRFDVPENVSYLNGSAFFGANSLRTFGVSAGNENFIARGGVLFDRPAATLVAYPAGLSGEYSLPDSVTQIGPYAFGYAKLTKIDLNSVQSIGRYAFAYSSLESLTIPDSVTFFDEYAFAYNYYLRDLTLGSGVDVISKYAFMYDFTLETLNIPANVQMIREWAFAYSGIRQINFAEDGSLMQIGDNVFFQCDVQSLAFPRSLMSVGGGAFARNYGLQSVSFAEDGNLQYIGGEAFGYAYSLRQISLPESLLEIGDYAFRLSGLSGTVTIPARVNYLGFGVFASCHDLQSIEVAEGNENYVDVSGVVYTIDEKTAVMYPSGNPAAAYEILGGTQVINEAAFYGAHNLTNIYMPESLTNIEAYAFYDVANLTAVDIPDNVIQISNYAFANDYRLASINFTENSKLPRISYAAFAYTGINSFRVPASVNSIAQYAFEGSDRLENITFAAGSGVESITAYMFRGCDSLRTIAFEPGSSLTSVQAHGFEGMKNLRSIDFGDAKIENIDNYAFRYAESLQSLTIPQGTAFIGRYAFYMAKSLTSLNLPSSVEFIGRYAFYGTNNLNVYFESETLPENLQENWDNGIGGYYLGVSDVITQGDWDYAVTDSGNISIIRYRGTETSIDLDALDLGEGGDIVSVGGYAFYDSAVTEISLPDTLTSIQRYAFAYSDLQSVEIPAEVYFIGQYAFYNTPVNSVEFAAGSELRQIEQYAFAYTGSLTEAALPASLRSLGSYAFYHSGIENVAFEEGIALTEIPAYAFGASGLLSVSVPDGVEYIDDNAFRDCRSLQTVEFGSAEGLQIHANVFYNTGITTLSLPANLEYIGEYAFVGLENLTAFAVSADNPYYTAIDGVLYNKDGSKLIAMPAGRTGGFTVPKEVETIGFGAFENTSLSEIGFEEGINLLTLGYRAFYNAENLTRISVPASVVSIDYYAFAECENLVEVEFAEDNKLTGIYEGAFLNCTSLKNIVIPDSIVEISDYAFYGCRSLTELPVSETSELKGIYDYAFAYTGLRELVVPETVIDIGEYAFMGARLQSVSVSDANKLQLIIGIGAFADCDEMKEITLPFVGASYEDDQFTWFGYIFGAGDHEANAAYVPESLETVTISEGITNIGSYAFYELTGLKEIHVPHSVTALYTGAFDGTTALYELTNTIILYNNNDEIDTPSHGYFGYGLTGTLRLAEGITNVAPWAMDGMLYLEELILPDSMVEIGYCAFYNCYELVRITLGTGLTEIGGDAFVGCLRLSEIYNHSSLQLEFGSAEHGQIANLAQLIVSADGTKTYKDGEFVYIDTPDGFRFLQQNDTYQLIDYNGEADIIELPVSINGSAYDIYLSRNNRIKKVVVPEGITELAQNAFSFCDNLIEVQLPESLTVIGDYAFQGCTNLREICLPLQVQSIPGWCFDQCKSLENVVFPDGLTYIGDSAFDSCSSLSELVVPNSVTYIRYSAFANCTGLKKVYIGSGLSNFASTTFSGCTQLEELTFSPENNFYMVEDNGFVYNREQTELLFVPKNIAGHVTLPDGLKTIGGRVFAECSEITEITIPDSVTEIGYSAFCNCVGLKSINLPDGLTNLPWGIFEGCISLTSIKIPSNVTNIDSYAFAGCTNLADVTIPYGVVGIGSGAFQYCKAFEKLVLPDSITGIGVYAFTNCTGLREVILSNGMTELPRDVFDNCYNLERVTIPASISVLDSGAFDGCTKLYEVINNSALPIQFGGTTYGALEAYVRVIVNADGTVMRRSEDVISIETEDGFRFVKEDGVYSLDGYVGNNSDITLPENIENSNYSINLRGVSNIRSVVVPEGFTQIDDFAFFGCVNLENVTLPSTIKRIGGSAFTDCISLKVVNMQSGIEEVGSDAFSNSTSLEKAVLPETVTKIGSRVFQNTAFYNNDGNWKDGGLYSGTNLIAVNKQLVGFIVPENTTCIAEDAFEDCFVLTQVTIGGEHYGALYSATNLRTLILTDMPSRVYGYFDQYGATVPVTLENIVIKFGAFVERSDVFGGISGVTIYVEEIENNVMWDLDYPGWNNGNTVYYGGEWIRAEFRDFEGNRISNEYYTTQQIIRQPFVSDIVNGNEKFVFIGWDLDGDGIADTVPATSGSDITATAVMQTTEMQYNIVYRGFDGEVLYSYALPFGTEIVLPTAPEKRGYVFDGWIGYVPGMTVNGDITFYSDWTHAGDGHEYQFSVVAPTCTEEGYDRYVCSLCGDEYRDNYTEALGHVFGDWIVSEEAGCETSGLRYRVCETCGAREEEIISAVGHDYAGRVTRQPTCQHTGEKVYVCAHCGDEITETLAATEHRYEKKVVNKSWLRWLLELLANMFFGYEGEDAYYYQCTVCGKVMTGDEMSVMGVSSAEPHEHRLTDWDVLLPPTCEDGIEVRYCEICGEAIEAVVVPADDTHVFGDWRLAESGTAVERECESCGEVQIISVSGEATLTLEDEIKVNYKVGIAKPEGVPADVSAQVLVYESADAQTAETLDMIYENATGYYVAANARTYAAKEIVDSHWMQFRITVNGIVIESGRIEYSPKIYAMNMLSKGDGFGKTDDLVLSMLDYAAAAQNYFGYKTDNLANADVTEEMRAAAEAYRAEVYTQDRPYQPQEFPWYPEYGVVMSLNLDGKVSVNGYLTAAAGEEVQMAVFKSAADAEAGIGAAAEIVAMQFTDGSYKGTTQTTEFAAKEFGDDVYLVFYVNGEEATPAIRYGVETYAYNKLTDASAGEKIKALCEAMLNYASAAQMYFNYNTDDLANAGLKSIHY